jgi:hypothetical protein
VSSVERIYIQLGNKRGGNTNTHKEERISGGGVGGESEMCPAID